MTTDNLALTKPEVVQQELASEIDAPSSASEQQARKWQAQADSQIAHLFTLDARQLTERQIQNRAIASLGAGAVHKVQKCNHLLAEPISSLMKDAEDGGPVATSLLQLQEQVNEINPNLIDFDMGTIRRWLSKLPFIGTPLSQWFARHQAVSSVIQDIIKQLEEGKRMLQRDNQTLTHQQIQMREATFELQDYVSFGLVLKQRLDARVETLEKEDEKRRFLEDEICFPLNQRIMDLQQNLAVNSQGVVTSEIIIRNNKELIRGVERSLNVTITALQVASTLAVALQKQKRVLDSVQAVNRTTDDLILQTSSRLKHQGTAIHKQASTTMLDVEKLRQSFTNVLSALDDVSNFRRAALPEMAKQIEEMALLNKNMDAAIEKMEKGSQSADEFSIQLSANREA